MQVPADKAGKNVPDWYKVTNCTKERPDLWLKNPYQGVVLQVRYLLLPGPGSYQGRGC